MSQLLAPLLGKAAAAVVQAIVTRLLLQLWTAYARKWHAHAAAAQA